MKINLDRFYTYNEMLSTWIAIHKNYPVLTTIFSIGQSHENRELICIKLGKGCDGPVMLSGVHGRERINPIVLTAICAKYCSQYYSEQAEFQYLNNFCIYFIPLLNPDGYELASTCKQKYTYKANARGIDLNRNFSSVNFTITTGSDLPFSENETKAFRNFCKSHATTGLIDFHSRGESIYYFRQALDNVYNQRQYQLAKQLSYLTGYSLNTPWEENIDGISGGNSVNFYSETYHKPAITIETVSETETFPLPIYNQYKTFQTVKEVPLYFSKALMQSAKYF